MDGGGRTDLREPGPVLLRESARYRWVPPTGTAAVRWDTMAPDDRPLTSTGDPT